MSSADTTPISPARFAAALKGLSIEMLHLKVLEIRNSIAHLQYSNDQLRPFAEGSATAATATTSSQATGGGSEPDQDCIDAIRENELVIDRMAERIALVRVEVEDRGASWTEFQSKEEADEAARQAADAAAAAANGANGANGINGTEVNGAAGRAHSAWTDGTFQTGTIRNGEVTLDDRTAAPARQAGGAGGGGLSDEQLQRALEERMRELASNDDGDDGGMHL
jgi:hypothetical protein